jgi:hypothetical protein
MPPGKIGSDNNDVLELIVVVDARPTATADCRIVRQDRLAGFVTCAQSGVGILQSLSVVAKLTISAEVNYDKTMADVFYYLINDVFDCGPIGSHI